MADIFCNIDNAGVTDGTSEATGFTDLRDAWAGATQGDRIFILAGSTAYKLEGSNVFASPDNDLDIDSATTNKRSLEVIGYKGTTGTVPTGDDRPEILCNRTNGASVYLPRGGSISNIRFDSGTMRSSNNYAGTTTLNSDAGRVFNCKFNGRSRDDSATIGDRSVVVQLNSCNVRDCEFIWDIPDSQTPIRDATYNNAFGLYESDFINCIFRITSDSSISAFIRMRAAYGNKGNFINCIFIGNGNQQVQEPSGNAHTQSFGPGGNFRNCIFYNLGDAIKPLVPTSTSAARNTENEFQNEADKLKIQNCIFMNCNRAVYIPSYSDPSGWSDGTFTMEHVVVLQDCAFYNNTVANTEGDMRNINPIQLTADPFTDAANGDFTLNDTAGGGALLKARDVDYDIASTFFSRSYGAGLYEPPNVFSITDEGSLSLGTGDVGDSVTVSGRTFQKVSEDPIVWRRA